MSGPEAHGGLGTRVALRTFVIFGLSAALPVALFAAFGYFYVSNALADSSRARLAEASKRYGVALNERLIQAETRLLDAARLKLESATNAPSGGTKSAITSSDLVDAIRSRPFDLELPPGWRVARRLQIDLAEGAPVIRLRVALNDGTREVELTAEPAQGDFWNADAGLPGTRACVFVLGTQLHCETSDGWQGDSQSLQSSEWTLFLKPRFGADSWVVRLEEPTSATFGALHSFRSTLPIVALLAMGIAWLLSFTHIRRINRPLTLLAAAARRMSRGRFGKPVEIVSDDEFASVGRALNHLDARLKQQFGLLTTLAEMDRQILEHPTFQPVVATLLSRMPRILGCVASAVAIDGETSPLLQMYRAGAVDAGVETLAGGDVEAALRIACPAAQLWIRESISVDGKRRGTLLAGFRVARRAARAGTRRQLRGLAHRLAVALGNEDRERALLRQAYFDPLTGLANRQLCRDRLSQALLLNRRDNQDTGLLHLDLDHFKTFNDSLGQAAGDMLLRAVAARLASVQRAGDTLARIGADEFVIVCPDCGSQPSAALATRIRAALQAPFAVGGESYVVQASIGIAVAPKNGTDAEELLRCASAAVSRAKSAGRNRTAFFEEGMNREAERRLLIERRLRNALEHGALTLAFQPKFRASDRSLSGFEALTRWHDAELGPMAPSEFIPVAEDSGLIEKLGMVALQESCRQMREWRALGTPSQHVAVNVSVHQLRDPQFSERVLQCLIDHGLSVAELELEVTESALATDSGVVLQQLGALRAAGIRIAMDDFGTGYSTMAALRELPIDVLKIDRSFVIRSCDSHTDEALLRGLIELAHTMGKIVVAEGVEEIAQLDLLRRLGCDTVQGYLLARPLAAADVPDFIRGCAEGIESSTMEGHQAAESAALSASSLR